MNWVCGSRLSFKRYVCDFYERLSKQNTFLLDILINLNIPKMLSLVIVEDDIETIEHIMSIIDSSFSDIEVKGISTNINTALSMIQDHAPDLVLLDIDFLGVISFEFVKKLNAINFKVIYITAYDKYALRAIKLNALDYLLKPVIKIK